MSDYKLTTGVVRASYILPHGDVEAQGAEFDRWLNEHTAQALETAARNMQAVGCGEYYNPVVCETCRTVESLREEAEALRSRGLQD